MKDALMQTLPVNKYQLIGFIVWVVCQDLLAFFIGKSEKTEARCVLEAIFLFVLAAGVAVIGLFKRGKKNDSNSNSTPGAPGSR
jgi:membrane protein DedA with SNARE-associated domain